MRNQISHTTFLCDLFCCLCVLCVIFSIYLHLLCVFWPFFLRFVHFLKETHKKNRKYKANNAKAKTRTCLIAFVLLFDFLIAFFGIVCACLLHCLCLVCAFFCIFCAFFCICLVDKCVIVFRIFCFLAFQGILW